MFNISLLSKWRWRVLNGDSSALWRRVLEARYGLERPWFGNLMPVNVARKTSLWWRDLALLGEETSLGLTWFNEVAKKRMGNGATIKFWTDKWMGPEPLVALFPSVMAVHNDKNAVVADMGVWEGSGWVWKWNTEVAGTVFAAGSAEVAAAINEFVDFMQGIQPNSMVDEDRWVWLLDTPRGFTVKSCYCWLCNQVTNGANQIDVSVLEACKALWLNDIPSKILIFCWRLLLNKLPTRDNLFRRGVLSGPHVNSCVLCSNNVETGDHLFCRCSVVQEVWKGVFAWLNVQQDPGDDAVQMFKDVGDLIRGIKAKRVKNIFWAATVYQVWMARNRLIFNNMSTSAKSIVTSIKYVSWGWFMARRGRNSGLVFSDWFSSPMGCIATL